MSYFFFSYVSNYHVYICLNRNTSRVYIARHVQFDQSIYFFLQISPSLSLPQLDHHSVLSSLSSVLYRKILQILCLHFLLSHLYHPSKCTSKCTMHFISLSTKGARDASSFQPHFYQLILFSLIECQQVTSPPSIPQVINFSSYNIPTVQPLSLANQHIIIPLTNLNGAPIYMSSESSNTS